MKNFVKQNAKYLIVLAIFIAIAIAYCSPFLTGKTLVQHDTASWKGMSKEAVDFHEKTGEWSGWTNSMFSGMPTYQIAYEFDSSKPISFLAKISHLGFPMFIVIILTYLICGFLLLKSLKVSTWISVAGAIALAFSSYFFIIIQAGHETKAYVIGCMMGVIASFIFIFQQKKYLWGAIGVMFFMAIQFWLSHVQMTYYYFLLIAILFITEVIIHIKSKKIKELLIASCIFFASVGVGIGTFYSFLETNQQYSKETMRGGHSELTTDSKEKNTGLDIKYATQWSYGIDETMTLLIPNFKGGASNMSLGESSNLYESMIEHGVSKNDAKKYVKNAPSYWGKQPSTSGPTYAGAVVIFLFILSLFVVKSPYKWALLIGTLFSILLSWGSNFMWLTELFMNYFPMYNKFRAVSSIMVVAEVCIPVLGILAIKAIFDGSISKEYALKSIKISAYVTGGICLFFLLFGTTIYDFTSQQDAAILTNVPQWYIDSVIADRISLFRIDAFRSLVFVVLTALTLFFTIKGKLKMNYFYGLLIGLVLVDMWAVDKRYFNNDDFVSKKNAEIPFQKTNADQLILQDPDPNYRVLNLTVSTFNDASTSFYHKSIGGYHGAKLRRYQDMIEHHISRNNVKVFNMLNTKYFIVSGQDGTPDVQHNVAALGNAWFVDSIRTVSGPNAEINALTNFEPASVAVVDTPFVKYLSSFTPNKDSLSTISLTSYKPNELIYKASAKKNELSVFSEVYYADGWQAYIDNKPANIIRVNYILRALVIPAGEHTIKFKFEPASLKKTEIISSIFVWIFILTLVGGIIYTVISYIRKSNSKEIN